MAKNEESQKIEDAHNLGQSDAADRVMPWTAAIHTMGMSDDEEEAYKKGMENVLGKQL